MANPTWLNAYPNFIAKNLDFFNSDHRPVSINTEAKPVYQNDHQPKPFMFNHCWILEEKYGSILNDGWDKFKKEANIHRALYLCSKHIKEWATVNVGSLANKIKTVRHRLSILDHEANSKLDSTE